MFKKRPFFGLIRLPLIVPIEVFRESEGVLNQEASLAWDCADSIPCPADCWRHKMNALKRFLSRATASLFLLALYASGDTPNPGDGGAKTPDFPKISLRGYGTVGGTFTTTTADGQAGSVLAIDCENEEKAKMVQAKFLSDEQELPGVQKTQLKARQWGLGSFRFGGAPFSAYEVKGQGFVAAVRGGNKVLIAAAPTGDGLVALVNGMGTADAIPSDPEAQVPMWLDRWDQYGFRFYYAPGSKPPGQNDKEYDVRQDFQFAHDSHAGMVFWDNLSHIMGADGQTDYTSWSWADDWARAQNLPLAINISSLNYDMPSWLANRYRDGMMHTLPYYLGDSMSVANDRGTSGKVGELAWGATEARDAMLAALQVSVRHFDKEPNVVSWCEPHGEISQAGDDFVGYGPAADEVFRNYLRTCYTGPDQVGTAWHGNAAAFKSWDDIHVPELAEFAGWSSDALDIGGAWRVNFPDGAPSPDMFTPAFDDSKWLAVTAPGDDRNLYLPKKPAVYRRTFDLPADWLAHHPKVWIYLWDLNFRKNDPNSHPSVSMTLNGQKVEEDPLGDWRFHWMAPEATTYLKAGANQITLTLPMGYLGYRIYLTGVEPKQYPNLGEGLNTEWVDYCNWRQWARVESVRRGMEMIREVDPNRPITMMAPNYAANGEKVLAAHYGGEFHDTGFMSGNFSDFLPALMRGSDLPMTVETGGSAVDLTDFEDDIGNWQTEGLAGVDYFIHIGDVMWNPAIRKHFEEQLPQLHLIGKYHLPKADLALLFSTTASRLTGYPWMNDFNTNLPGADYCQFQDMLAYCPRDAVSESDFALGNAAKYKVILDTNTSIMDDAFIGQIEKYVRDGGIFVTFVASGRHSPTKPDSWPISRLTGYDVLTQERFDAKGNTQEFPNVPNPPGTPSHLTLRPADGQNIYPKAEPWMNSPYHNGLRMKKRAGDAQDLLLWSDGSVAVGMRKIGKGAIIEFGCKHGGQPWLGIEKEAFKSLFTWAGVKPNRVDVTIDKPNARLLADYIFRTFVSNNGLYDLTTVWNQSRTDAVKATLVYNDSTATSARDAVTGEELPIQNGKLADVPLAPMATRVFITPRNRIADAAADWFDLQRKWWRATTPVSKPLPKPSGRFVDKLTGDWAFHPLADKEDVLPLVEPGCDDSKWSRVPLGAWTPNPQWKDVNHAVLRSTFTVPKEWNDGRVELWMQSPTLEYSENGQVWLDGKIIQKMTQNGESTIDGLTFNAALTPGSTHHLAVEIVSQGVIAGITGDVWLNYIPAPDSTLDLAGTWTICKDDLFHDTGTVTLPGDYIAHSLWRTIAVPAVNSGKTVMLSVEADRPFQAFINGTRVEYSGRPWTDAHVEMNITPWVHFGGDNRIQLVSTYDHGTIRNVDLDFYTPGNYP